MSQQRSFVQRMVGAALLDVDTYEEVEHDSGATLQAASVVALVAACGAIGSWGGPNMASAAIQSLIGWALISGATYLIGVKFFGGEATWGEVLRTVGFAQSPGTLAIVGLVPLLGGFVKLALWFWILAAVIVAVRQALDVSTGKAVVAAFLGWLATLILGSLLMGSWVA